MECPVCGHKKLNENAPFCSGCGRPFHLTNVQNSKHVNSIDIARKESSGSRGLVTRIGGIALFVVLAAVAGTIVLHRYRASAGPVTKRRSPGTGSVNSTSVSSIAIPSDAASSGIRGSESPAPIGSTAVSSTLAPSVPVRANSATVSQSTNLVSLAMGGNVDKVSSQVGMNGMGAMYLLDDLPPDTSAGWAGVGWAAEPAFPQEVVLSFFGHQPARISSVEIMPVHGPGLFPEDRAKDVEIWTSDESADAGFLKVAQKTFAKDGGEEALSFSPIEARYVKIRILSNYGSDQDAIIGKVRVTEASGNGYIPLLQRNPDLAALFGGAPMETIFKPSDQNSAVPNASPDALKTCQPTTAAPAAPQNASRNVLVLEETDDKIFDEDFNNYDEIVPWFKQGGKELVWKEPRWATPARLLNAEGFDTVVLSEICDIKTSVSDEFKKALVAWVMQGHKLIIRDADGCVPGPDYSFLPHRFVTNNVACGCEGHHLKFVEENSIGNAQAKDPSFLNLDKFALPPNELGDSNVIVDWDSNWCGHMITTNANGVTGFVEAYSHLGRGLIIYDGFDHDNYAVSQYRRLLRRELEQPFDPDGLSCSSRIGHFIVTTDLKLHNQPVYSTAKTYIYPLTVFANQAYKGDLKLSATAIPPDPSLSFHFDADNLALTHVSKTQLTVATTAETPAIPRALEVRATDTKGESNALCVQWTEAPGAPTEESIKAELEKTGRAILYINFDFNKASIRPDGKPIIAQVLKLLKDNPEMQLAINGHTDNVGSHDYNVKLSAARAAAVVKALETVGISPDRLSSAGFGPDQPIADNKTGKGRAKNRRVELVKK